MSLSLFILIFFFFQAEDGIRDLTVTGVQTCAFFFQAEDGIRDLTVTGVQTCALPISRFVALGFNRIADRELDARNPRTRARELPAGRLSLGQAWSAVAIAAAVFLGTAWALNPLCLALAPVALVFISGYSYAKRFMHWSHLWLGLADGIATPAGYLAVTGRWSDPWWTLVAGAAAVTFWVGGFDVFYALPDGQFDRRERLKSLVVRFGPAAAVVLAKVLHGLAGLGPLAFGVGAGVGLAYFAAVAAAAGVLGYEHQLVRPGGLSR